MLERTCHRGHEGDRARGRLRAHPRDGGRRRPRHRRPPRRPAARRSPARPAPPTTTPTPGSSASRPRYTILVWVGYDQKRSLGTPHDRRRGGAADLAGSRRGRIAGRLAARGRDVRGSARRRRARRRVALGSRGGAGSGARPRRKPSSRARRRRRNGSRAGTRFSACPGRSSSRSTARVRASGCPPTSPPPPKPSPTVATRTRSSPATDPQRRRAGASTRAAPRTFPEPSPIAT